MAQGLPHPVLLSSSLGIDYITILGKEVEFKHVFYTWCAMALLFMLGLLVRSRIQKYPTGLPHVFEVIVDGLEQFSISTMGENAKRVISLLVGIFLFILFQNLLGLVPSFDAPTANINTTAALAIFVFLYYNALGVKIWGFGYIKHFTGPVSAIAPLMLPIELISHFARPLSLALRLFGNIRGEEIVLLIFFILAPIVGTIPIYFLFMFAKILQAFIFYLLTLLYIKGAMEHAH
ncbi:MAG: F0F1 ATP synthase subunit A [Desulfovibrionaceae bacterium]